MSPRDLQQLADLLGRLVDERVAVRLAELGIVNVDVYSTTTLPPRVSRRTFNEACRKIPAARKEGRAWVCPAAAWREVRSAAPKPRGCAGPKLALVEADPHALLEAAGLRRTRGTR